MKVVMLAAAASLIIHAFPVMVRAAEAPDPHAGHHTSSETKAQAATYKASGVVKKVDAAKGSITLAHGPVPALKWPAMTMSFNVKDKALLEKLVVNRKIDFEFVEEGKSYVVTTVK